MNCRQAKQSLIFLILKTQVYYSTEHKSFVAQQTDPCVWNRRGNRWKGEQKE